MEEENVRKRLLLAEEDDFRRQIIRDYLEYANRFEVLEAQGIHHVLSICESRVSGIAAVLLDMEWSCVDGVDLILEIRRRDPALPILGMADCPEEFYGEPRLQELPLLGFISKPFASHRRNRRARAVASGSRFPAEIEFSENSRLGFRPLGK